MAFPAHQAPSDSTMHVHELVRTRKATLGPAICAAMVQGQELSWHLSASHQAILVSCISWKKFRRSTGSTGSTATLLVLYYLLATAFRTSLTSKCMFAGNKEDVSRRHLSQYCKSIKWNWPSHLDLFTCIAYLIVNWNILIPDPTAQS